MGTFDAGLASGYVLRLDTWLGGQDQNANATLISWRLHILKGSGSGKWAQGPHYWSVTVHGTLVGSGSIGSYDFRNYTDLTLGQGSNWFANAGDGTLTTYSSAGFNDNDTWGELGDGNVGGYDTWPRIAKVPGAPISLAEWTNPDQIGPTSMRYRFSGTTDGGSGILEWQAEYSTSSSFAAGTVTAVTSNGTSTITGLNPGTTYYFRARGRNAVGWGPYGAHVNGTTLSADPPTLTVAPSVTGFDAVLTMVPPASIPTPDSYKIERRVTGTTSPVTTLTAPASPYTATGLTAGTSYDWRAALVVGGYTSGFSGWVTAVQPAPNTNPGDYFDGSTPAKPDLVYSWDGTVNNSTSKATGKAPLGWALTSETAAAGVAVLYRQTGGRTRSFAARLSFIQTATVAGYGAGTATGDPGRATVGAGGRYWGSVYVQSPLRTQRLAARIRWVDAAGALLGVSALGTALVVPKSSTEWTRVSVFATAPTNTAFAAVQVVDVEGDGWSPWVGGDFLVLDDAMISLGELYPYFDGSTPDTSTYDYVWMGTEEASASQRLTITSDVPVDPFADPDCDPVPVPPRPPLVDTDCIVEVGTWRRYWAVVAPQNVLDWIADLPTLTLRTGAVEARQVRIRVYQNPDNLPPDVFPADAWVSEQIISYMPAHAEYVLSGVDETMVGSLDAGATWTNLNHLLYGTGSTPATWPVLRCGDGYLISFDVPLEAPAGNLNVEIALTRRL